MFELSEIFEYKKLTYEVEKAYGCFIGENDETLWAIYSNNNLV